MKLEVRHYIHSKRDLRNFHSPDGWLLSQSHFARSNLADFELNNNRINEVLMNNNDFFITILLGLKPLTLCKLPKHTRRFCSLQEVEASQYFTACQNCWNAKEMCILEATLISISI